MLVSKLISTTQCKVAPESTTQSIGLHLLRFRLLSYRLLALRIDSKSISQQWEQHGEHRASQISEVRLHSIVIKSIYFRLGLGVVGVSESDEKDMYLVSIV